jgi:hypothetical protein
MPLIKSYGEDGSKVVNLGPSAAPRSGDTCGLSLLGRMFLERNKRRNTTNLDDIPPSFRSLALSYRFILS